MSSWVKDLASLLWLRSVCPWPRNFHMLWARPKKKTTLAPSDQIHELQPLNQPPSTLTIGFFSNPQLRPVPNCSICFS